MQVKKIVDYFHLAASAVLVFGLVITIVLVLNSNRVATPDMVDVPNYFLLLLPSLIGNVISVVLFSVYFWNRLNYFKLIRMHTKEKWFKYSHISVLVAGVGSAIGFIMLWLSQLVSMEDQNNWYFFLLIGIVIFFLIVSSGFESYSKFKISVDLIRRRLGEEEAEAAKAKEAGETIEGDTPTFENKIIKESKTDEDGQNTEK